MSQGQEVEDRQEVHPLLWGLIYSHLDNKEDRRNFTHVCKDCHDSPCVRVQITKLVVKLEDDDNFKNRMSIISSIASFPSDHLHTLVLDCGFRSSMLPINWSGAVCFPSVRKLVVIMRERQPGVVYEGDLSILRAFPNVTAVQLDGVIFPVRVLQSSFAALNSLQIEICGSVHSFSELEGDNPSHLPLLTLSTLAVPSYFSFNDVFLGLQHLYIAHMYSMDFIRLKRDLDEGMFPNLQSLEIGGVILLNMRVFESGEYDDSRMESLKRSVDLFHDERIRVGRSFEVWYFYDTGDNMSAFNHNDAVLQGFVMDVFEVLLRGGLVDKIHMVRQLKFAHMNFKNDFIQVCARHFPLIDTLCFHQSVCDGLGDSGQSIVLWGAVSCVASFHHLLMLDVSLPIVECDPEREAPLLQSILMLQSTAMLRAAHHFTPSLRVIFSIAVTRDEDAAGREHAERLGRRLQDLDREMDPFRKARRYFNGVSDCVTVSFRTVLIREVCYATDLF
ncbi:hypothetical protein DUNSADRAFT_15278 [Dunaliella salina]|uniref:Encoded protein n=1 Tax=Dunaliella salina TaxID=3046 RepID=A0ABQ7G5W1_DUNSA|nr:hypothetical protein DUNSADRAFT_15278 [Dunaliella salina]|eukprot:KAF5829959.1 hypothetical protein DUNSADRAFT_15278 [Dunaliella salina]